jgi:hypothetical protein
MWDSPLTVRQYPLKEQNAVGGGATEPSTRPPGPYVGKFSHKIKIRSKDDSDSDLVSIEEVQEDVPVH